MLWLFVVALWSAMLLSPVLLLVLFLPSGRSCPRCGGETLRIHSRLLRPFRRMAHLRWCPSCRWEGVMRTVIWRRPLPKLEVVPEDAEDADGDASWRTRQD